MAAVSVQKIVLDDHDDYTHIQHGHGHNLLGGEKIFSSDEPSSIARQCATAQDERVTYAYVCTYDK